MAYFQDPNIRVFAGHILYRKAKKKFLKHAKFISKSKNTQKLVGTNGRFFNKICKYRFEKTISNVHIYKDDFIYSKQKSPTLHEFKFTLNDDISDKNKIIILPNDKIANKIKRNPVPNNLQNDLMTDDELKNENYYFSILNRLNSMHDSYFIYDHSNFVKVSFITESNKFVSIKGSITYFDEKHLLEIVPPHKTLKFEIEKDSYSNEVNLQITKVGKNKRCF